MTSHVHIISRPYVSKNDIHIPFGYHVNHQWESKLYLLARKKPFVWQTELHSQATAQKMAARVILDGYHGNWSKPDFARTSELSLSTLGQIDWLSCGPWRKNVTKATWNEIQYLHLDGKLGWPRKVVSQKSELVFATCHLPLPTCQFSICHLSLAHFAAADLRLSAFCGRERPLTLPSPP